MRREASEKLTGNAQFEGYAIDLIHEISKILGFNYTFKLAPDGRYGSYNRETKEWDGMIRELLEQRADLAIADLTITYDRYLLMKIFNHYVPLFYLSRKYFQPFLEVKDNCGKVLFASRLPFDPQPFVAR